MEGDAQGQEVAAMVKARIRENKGLAKDQGNAEPADPRRKAKLHKEPKVAVESEDPDQSGDEHQASTEVKSKRLDGSGNKVLSWYPPGGELANVFRYEVGIHTQRVIESGSVFHGAQHQETRDRVGENPRRALQHGDGTQDERRSDEDLQDAS